jgi:phosphopantetheine adenylyltransferase
MSAVCTKQKLMIGVSEGPLLVKKVLRELIGSFDTRRERLFNLLTSIRPGICYEIVPIQDPFGPSIVDPNLECIVVSKETEAGGGSVNRRRADAGLKQLDLQVIELVGPEDADEANKISSSGARRMLLGRFCGEGLPEWLLEGGQQGSKDWIRESPVDCPYVIGLTGGIASGKSTLTAMLAEMGAAVVSWARIRERRDW